MDNPTIIQELDTSRVWETWTELVDQHPELPLNMMRLLPAPSDESDALDRARALHRWFKASGLSEQADWMDPAFFNQLTGVAWTMGDGGQPDDKRVAWWYDRVLDAERRWFASEPLACVATGVTRVLDPDGNRLWVIHWDVQDEVMALEPSERTNGPVLRALLKESAEKHLAFPDDWERDSRFDLHFYAPSALRSARRLSERLDEALPSPTATTRPRL